MKLLADFSKLNILCLALALHNIVIESSISHNL